MRWSLKTALTLSFVLLASLPILLVGVVAVSQLTGSLEREIAGKNLLLARSYASELSRFLDNEVSDLEQVVRLLEDERFVAPEYADALLEMQVASHVNLEMVRVLDSAGIVTRVAPYDRNILGLDMSRQEYLVAARQRSSAGWSDVFISPQTGASTLALPIPYTGGMVVGHLSLAAVRAFVDSINVQPGRNITVVDRDGTAIAYPDQALVDQRSNLRNFPHIAAGVRGQEGTYRFVADEHEQIGSVAVVPETGWVVSVSQPLGEVIHPITHLRHMVYIGILLAMLTAVMAALVSLHNMLLPLRQLTRDAHRIAGGDYSYEPLTTSYREITELGGSLKTMIDQVRAREDSLREGSIRLKLATDASRIASWDWDLVQDRVYFSPEWKRQLGYDESEIPNRFEEWEVRLHPDDREAAVQAARGYLDGTLAEYDQEFRLLHKDGSYRWIYTRADKQINEQGNPIRMYGCHIDITERKQMDEAYRQSVQAFRDVIEQSPVSIQIHGLDGKLIQSNAAFAMLFALNQATLAELYEKYNVREDQQAKQRGLMPYIEQVYGGKEVLFPSYQYDGVDTLKTLDIQNPVSRTCWIRTRGFPLKDRLGNVTQVVFMSEDITEHRQAEIALKESEEKFRKLIEQSPISIQVMAPDGRITDVNHAWTDLWGFSEEGARDVLANYNMLEDEQARELGVMPLIEKAFEGEAIVLPVVEYDSGSALDTMGSKAKGNKIWMQVRLYPVKDHLGNVVSVVSMEEDITERKQSEGKIHDYQERLRDLAAELTLTEEAERRRIATELHDGAAQSLAIARMQLASAIKRVAEPSASSKLEELSQLLKESLQQIREVLLDLSSPVLNELGLSAALAEWLEEHAGRRHGLRTSFLDEAGDVPLTDDMLAVLFRNTRELLQNVVKHARASSVSVRLVSSEQELRIFVQDDGVGFDPDSMTDRSRAQGSFGLFSVRERMADLGGQLEIVSAPGKGCTATLVVPLDRQMERE